MTTKNLIPRASGEGGIGITDVTWGYGYYDTGNFNKGLFVSGHNITQVIAETVTQGGLGGEWTRNGLDIYYNGGNVGIGTTNPGAKLDVDGSIKSAFLVVNDNNMISSTEDAERFFHISGQFPSSIAYDGTSIGLPSVVNFANSAGFVVGGFQKMLNKGWVGEVSLDAIANTIAHGTTVTIQTSNDGVTWLDKATATTNQNLVYTNSTRYTEDNYLRVLLISSSGTANVSASTCKFSNLKITGIDSSLRDFYYNKNLIIDKNGNVGIGTTHPEADLHVTGSVKVDGDLAVDGTLTTINSTTVSVGGLLDLRQADGGVQLQMGRTNSSVGEAWMGADSNGFHLGVGPYGVDNTVTNPNGFSVDTVGRVGIGTSTPIHPFEVKKDVDDWVSRIYNTRSDSSSGGLLVRSDATAAHNSSVFGVYADGQGTNIYTAGYKFLVKSNGNVGIGTTSPEAKLDVQTNSFGSIAKLGTVDGHNNPRMFIGSSATGMYIRQSHTTGAGGFDFQDAGGGSKLFIEESGNVGIGTTGPGGKLHVTDLSVSIGTVTVTNTGTDVTDGTSLNTRISNGDRIKINNQIFTVSAVAETTLTLSGTPTNPGNFIAYTDNNALVITSAGRVGIGTTSPKFKLDVVAPATMVLGGSDDNLGATNNFNKSSRVGGIAYTNSDFPVNMMMHTSTASDSNLYFGSGTGTMYSPTKIIFGTAGNTTTLSSSPSNRRMFIHSNGNVSIGADNSSNKLYVNGNIFANGTITPTSDDRVKHNEQTIVGAIEILGKLTPKKYIKTTEMYDADHDFKLDANGDPVDENGEPVAHAIEAGVIAQQVLTVDELAFAVSPEGVDEDGKVTSPHGLDYNSLFTYAIAAIQEQQQLIEDLRSEVEALKNK